MCFTSSAQVGCFFITVTVSILFLSNVAPTRLSSNLSGADKYKLQLEYNACIYGTVCASRLSGHSLQFRYLYSPISFDSQDLNKIIYLPALQLLAAGAASPVTIVPKLRESAMEWRCSSFCHASPELHLQLRKMTMVIGLLPMGNGNAYNHPASDPAAPAPGYYGSWASASGNGEWRRMRCTCCQGRWSCTMSITQ